MFGHTRYVKGLVTEARLDLPRLELEPLRLEDCGVWDPEEEPWLFDEDSSPLYDEIRAAGAWHEAADLLGNLLTVDLRCLDAHAHLGIFEFQKTGPEALEPELVELHREEETGLGFELFGAPLEGEQQIVRIADGEGVIRHGVFLADRPPSRVAR